MEDEIIVIEGSTDNDNSTTKVSNEHGAGLDEVSIRMCREYKLWQLINLI
jgi:hypothetical protein